MLGHTIRVIATGGLALILSTTSLVPPVLTPPAAAQTSTLEQRVQRLETDVKAIQENNESANRKLDEIIRWINKVDNGSTVRPHPRPVHVMHKPIYVRHGWRWRCPPWWWDL